MLGGADVDPSAPSVTGLVARHAMSLAVSGARVPSSPPVATGSVIVPAVGLAPYGMAVRSGTRYVRAVSRPAATPTCSVSAGYGEVGTSSGGQPSGVVHTSTGESAYQASAVSPTVTVCVWSASRTAAPAGAASSRHSGTDTPDSSSPA